MEKAIEIKRRAQRCILNGDLDGALREYEKLIASGDSDPYHSVLLADLLYKKGDHEEAGRRYLDAISGYEAVGLTRNAIAVCKKMSRLSLNPAAVLQRLANLHALDGLATESSLYYMQHADLLAAEGKRGEAERSLREAFRVCPDNVRALERVAELQEQADQTNAAASTLLEAAAQHEHLGQMSEAKRCRARAEQLQPGISGSGAEAPRETSLPAPVQAEQATEMDELPVASFDEEEEEEESYEEPPAAVFGAGPRVPSSIPVPDPPRSVSYDAPAGRTLDLERPAEVTSSASDDGVEPVPADATAEDSVPRLALPTLPSAAGPALAASASDATPVRPGLGSVARDVQPAAAGADAEAEAAGLPEVSSLLNEAQELFKQGEREAASATLVRAAQTYDRLGRYESAASIYRSLSQVNEAPLQVMLLWLKNCQRRDDRREAARVACELGDWALMDRDNAGAREWFERAHAFDPENEVAERRLQRLAAAEPKAKPPAVPEAPPPASMPPASAAPPVPSLAPAPAASAVAATTKHGFVEVALDHEGPVGLDLGDLIAEFQRGIEEQLDSDPQGHYDLGMSYREMGLFDHAIASFRTCSQAPSFKVRASEMVGRCLLDQGDFDAAAAEFAHTLELTELPAASAQDLRYQLGLALEAGGRVGDAVQQFERVYSEQANYPDVAYKIRALRKMLETD